MTRLPWNFRRRDVKRLAFRALLLTVPVTVAAILLVSEHSLGPSQIRAGDEKLQRLPDTADHVHVLTVHGQNTTEGDEIIVTLDIDRGFHINANPASFDYLIPTRLALVGLDPVSVAYPPPVRFQPKFADTSIDVYEGKVAIRALLPKTAVEDTRRVVPLRAILTVQACDAATCLPPADLTIVLPSIRDGTTLHGR